MRFISNLFFFYFQIGVICCFGVIGCLAIAITIGTTTGTFMTVIIAKIWFGKFKKK